MMIADVVSFGLAPAVLAYTWALSSFGRVGWVGAFFYVACGAMRLARFNVISEVTPKRFFVGLPIPMAAMMVATTVIAHSEVPYPYYKIVALGMIFALGLLMVSGINFHSFKDFDLHHKRRFFDLVIMVIALICVVLKHEFALFVLTACYVCWDPLRELSLLVRGVFISKIVKSDKESDKKSKAA